MAVTRRNGKLIASFPVEDHDQIMLVTDGGQLIRCPINGIRIAGRGTQGVTVFNTAENEKVVSVEHLSEDEDDESDVEGGQLTDAGGEESGPAGTSDAGDASDTDTGGETDGDGNPE